MAREVIMPALGMAQETGVIVAWLKKPGEAVKAGDPLFEVETDKAVMAVEADADGVLADLRYGEGAEVPVGEVIARIAEAGEVGAELAAKADAVAPAPPTSRPASSQPGPASAAAPLQSVGAFAEKISPAPANGRILASPKARRLADERGIDLRALVRAGLPQPFRAADLDRMPQPRSGLATPTNRIAARAGAKAFLAFRRLLAEEGIAQSDAALWAAFAAGSLREVAGREIAALVMAVERPGGATALFRDPDIGPLAEVREAADDPPALILRDLTAGRLTEVALARDAVPSVSIAGGEDVYALSLAFPDGSLSEEEAIAFLVAFAARIEQPLRHLL